MINSTVLADQLGNTTLKLGFLEAEPGMGIPMQVIYRGWAFRRKLMWDVAGA